MDVAEAHARHEPPTLAARRAGARAGQLLEVYGPAGTVDLHVERQLAAKERGEEVIEAQVIEFDLSARAFDRYAEEADGAPQVAGAALVSDRNALALGCVEQHVKQPVAHGRYLRSQSDDPKQQGDDSGGEQSFPRHCARGWGPVLRETSGWVAGGGRNPAPYALQCAPAYHEVMRTPR